MAIQGWISCYFAFVGSIYKHALGVLVQKFRERLAILFEKSEFVYMILGFAYLGIYTVQVLVEPPAEIFNNLEIVADSIYWLFALDVALRLIHLGKDIFTWEGSIGFIRQNWLALLALLLPAFRALRVLRVVIVLRGLQPFLRTRSSRVGTIVGVTFPLILYTAALSVLEAERYAEGSNITNFLDAIWWAIASVTTVGYGDKFPVTGDGRLIATFLMVIGIGLFSALTALLAAWVMGDRKKESQG
jgi:voltage-gated potassium channel